MKPVALAMIVLAGVLAPAAHGHHTPVLDGGPADRSCGVIYGASKYGSVGVGASGKVSCRIARAVARGSVRGSRFERWRCVGKGTRFGHCHGKGIRRGSIVHWFANH